MKASSLIGACGFTVEFDRGLVFWLVASMSVKASSSIDGEAREAERGESLGASEASAEEEVFLLWGSCWLTKRRWK
ncbi:unnamed protein product, partial [Ilex paraguariensis]